jgi:thermostable 8-oxoguanine DNA glycosylase
MEITRDWIVEWAEKYDKDNQEEKMKEERVLKSIKAIGSPPAYLTKDVLKKIADWKASRTKGYIRKNNPKYVKEVTQVSLTAQNEKLMLEVLTLLNGVSIRMASAILQFCFPNQYTVMDWRAWQSLRNLGKISGEIEDTYECYKKYNDICQKIAKQFHVSLRTLDKALWQWKGGV